MERRNEDKKGYDSYEDYDSDDLDAIYRLNQLLDKAGLTVVDDSDSDLSSKKEYFALSK